jgi:hypothetical protein
MEKVEIEFEKFYGRPLRIVRFFNFLFNQITVDTSRIEGE